jgi:hypothetical protein
LMVRASSKRYISSIDSFSPLFLRTFKWSFVSAAIIPFC